MTQKNSPMVNEQEMQALEKITPSKAAEPTAKNLGVVDLSPKINRDERLQQLEYIEVNKENMNYGGKLYPTNYIFKCRAALGAEIANFSTIDNEDPISVNDGINDLLKSCLRIENSGSGLSYKNIYEMDRLWFVLFIRDLTLQHKEQDITYEVQCSECYESNTVHLSYDNLIAKKFTDIAKKYWDDSESAFMVQTKSYGILRFEPSTIFRAELFKDWMIEQSKHRQKPNASFVKLFWMLINSETEHSKDAVKNAYNQYVAISNDSHKLSLYMKLNDELQLGLTEQIKYTCDHCEKEAYGDIRFPDGISNLLLMSDISSELL